MRIYSVPGFPLCSGKQAEDMHCTENSKQIFPEMKLSGLIPYFYIYESGSNLYIPMIGLV
jgi:hypothetical protein